MASQPVKRLSCRRCQYRKLKCSRTEPCLNCATADQSCEYRQVDRKRRPATHEYVVSLENRVAWLESFIADLRAATKLERDAMLERLSFGECFQTSSSGDVGGQSERAVAKSAQPSSSILQVDIQGSLIYHGATSIYRANIPGLPTNLMGDAVSYSLRYNGSGSNFEYVAEHFGIDLQDDLITDALMQFFKWQYPHFMFIYREAFLRDHFGSRINCKYWSSALLLSICALGTLMSPNQTYREASERFFSAAESILIVSGLAEPSIVTIQGFLCLAFYEIGKGNLSKGWGLSGIAFRMAQDLGIQRDPKHWISQDALLVTKEDTEIRRRIFWGCYTSDKLISLILGRPVYLGRDHAEVDTAQKLPDFPQMKPWFPAGLTDPNEDFEGTNTLVPCFKEQIKLSKIIEKILSNVSWTTSNMHSLEGQECLKILNLELCRWYESLPDGARWNRWEPSSKHLMPSVAALHLLFHSVRIAFNFDHAASTRTEAMVERSRKDCLSSAHDVTHIIRKYRSQYNLKHGPIIMVYAIMQGVRALKAFGATDEAEYLFNLLNECGAAWELAHQVRKKLHQTRG